jgi:hypothetical protein
LLARQLVEQEHRQLCEVAAATKDFVDEKISLVGMTCTAAVVATAPVI